MGKSFVMNSFRIQFNKLQSILSTIKQLFYLFDFVFECSVCAFITTLLYTHSPHSAVVMLTLRSSSLQVLAVMVEFGFWQYCQKPICNLCVCVTHLFLSSPLPPHKVPSLWCCLSKFTFGFLQSFPITQMWLKIKY